MDTSIPNQLLTTPALELVAAELRRVRLQLGYSPARDDQYTKGELTDAALAYLVAPQVREQLRIAFEPGAPSAETVAKVCHWPWPVDTFKPATDDSTEGRIRELVKGVGLAVSEISRLQRAAGVTMQWEPVPTFDLIAHLHRQIAFSRRSLGPGRIRELCDLIRIQLAEIETANAAGKPETLEEWVAVIILALDGAWRGGGHPEEICFNIAAALVAAGGDTKP